MRRIFFVDLDDTLFHTPRKLPAPSGPDDSVAEAVAFDRNGAPISYRRARQRALFDWLSHEGEIVPTTGRNLDAFQRVRLPITGHAICSFGGLIVTPAGVPEPRWHGRIADQAASHGTALAELVGQILQLAGERAVDVRACSVVDAGLDLYVSVKHNREDSAALAAFAVELQPALAPGWSMHLNDNNLAFMPAWLGKHHAVQWFVEHLMDRSAGPVLSVGVGDSLSDAPFMGVCDYALTPTRSQLFARWGPPA